MRYIWIRIILCSSIISIFATAELRANKPSAVMLEYYVVRLPLSELLIHISRDSKLEIEFDSETEVSVTSSSFVGTGIELLDQLSSRYNMSHFVFNGQIYVSLIEDHEARIISSDDHSMEEMLSAVREIGIPISEYSTSVLASKNAFILTAPPRLIGIVEAVVTSLPPKDPVKGVVVRRGASVAVD